MSNHLVSICIPTMNSGKYLEDSLNNILRQSYSNIEIIIGDNASTDNTVDIIKRYAAIDSRISFFCNNINIGYSKNCNKLISFSSGEYISVYHSDDIYDRFIVEKEVKTLLLNPDLLGVFTSYVKIDENGIVIKDIQYPIHLKQDLTRVYLDQYIRIILKTGGNCFCCPTSMIRRDVYDRLHGYNENLKFIEDQDMWARILLRGPIGIIGENLLQYRIHSQQGSSVYLNRKLDRFSIPLEHITSFIENNNLKAVYYLDILKAQSIELILMAITAIKLDDFNLFCSRIHKSKITYALPLLSKFGFVQRFPNTRLLYMLLKYFY